MDKNGYNESLLTGWEEVCFLTGQTNCDLVRHEIFFGVANRELSKKYGMWVYLVPQLHNGSKSAVHNNRELDLALKRTAQEKFEETHSREEFIRIFGRSYLD